MDIKLSQLLLTYLHLYRLCDSQPLANEFLIIVGVDYYRDQVTIIQRIRFFRMFISISHSFLPRLMHLVDEDVERLSKPGAENEYKKHVLQTHRSLHIEAQNSCDEVQELHVSPNQNKKQHRDDRKTEGPISSKEAIGNDSFLDKKLF